MYYPLVTQQEYLAAQSNRFINKLCGGNLSTFANALCDSGLSEEEIAQLRELLERRQLLAMGIAIRIIAALVFGLGITMAVFFRYAPENESESDSQRYVSYVPVTNNLALLFGMLFALCLITITETTENYC